MSADSTLPATVSLIGMPGAGKSTVGVLLAKLCGLRFVDTDIDIQLRAGKTLQQIVEGHGYLHLRQLEQAVLLDVGLTRAVISTGGSVVYSDAGMQRLKQAGPVIYLQAALQVLEQRIAAAPLRGIACPREQTFAGVYAERTPLYQRYADITVAADAGSADEVAAKIHHRLIATAAAR